VQLVELGEQVALVGEPPLDGVVVGRDGIIEP
jgi:hypothetical protein